MLTPKIAIHKAKPNTIANATLKANGRRFI